MLWLEVLRARQVMLLWVDVLRAKEGWSSDRMVGRSRKALRVRVRPGTRKING